MHVWVWAHGARHTNLGHEGLAKVRIDPVATAQHMMAHHLFTDTHRGEEAHRHGLISPCSFKAEWFVTLGAHLAAWGLCTNGVIRYSCSFCI